MKEHHFCIEADRLEREGVVCKNVGFTQYQEAEENILDIDDELHNLVREAIDTDYGLVQEDDIDITPLLVTSSSIVAFPEQKLSEIFPVIHT